MSYFLGLRQLTGSVTILVSAISSVLTTSDVASSTTVPVVANDAEHRAWHFVMQ